MNLLTNLISHWKLDEASGADAVDSHGAHTLTHTVASGSIGTTTGKMRGARVFTAANSQRFSKTSHADFVPGNADFMFSAWCRLTGSFSFPMLIAKSAGNTVAEEIMLHFDTATTKFTLKVSNDGTNIGTVAADSPGFGTVDVDIWYLVFAWHVASTSINIQVYSESVQYPVYTLPWTTGVWTGGTAPFRIGSRGDASLLPWNGNVDEVSYWKGRVLNQDERDMLWNGGNVWAYPFNGLKNLNAEYPTGSLPNYRIIRIDPATNQFALCASTSDDVFGYTQPTIAPASTTFRRIIRAKDLTTLIYPNTDEVPHGGAVRNEFKTMLTIPLESVADTPFVPGMTAYQAADGKIDDSGTIKVGSVQSERATNIWEVVLF